MATTLKDILIDMKDEILENSMQDYVNQKDPNLIVDEYIDTIKRRLIG